MPRVIHVRPASGLRVEFARWAVAQTPKVRTVSEVAFGVPVHLYPLVPAALLVGALVDGQPYVPPAPPAELAAEPSADGQGDAAEGADDPDGDSFMCGECGREFDTGRGLAAHRRQAHETGGG